MERTLALLASGVGTGDGTAFFSSLAPFVGSGLGVGSGDSSLSRLRFISSTGTGIGEGQANVSARFAFIASGLGTGSGTAILIDLTDGVQSIITETVVWDDTFTRTLDFDIDLPRSVNTRGNYMRETIEFDSSVERTIESKDSVVQRILDVGNEKRE
jgi:hypothetical protein